MAIYVRCPYCGANLDPGEKCECQMHGRAHELSYELKALVEHYAGYELTMREVEAAYYPARKKLDDLIKRFGNDGGQRNKPEYLAQLIAEQIRSSRYAAMLWTMSELKKEAAASQKRDAAATLNCTHIISEQNKYVKEEF